MRYANVRVWHGGDCQQSDLVSFIAHPLFTTHVECWSDGTLCVRTWKDRLGGEQDREWVFAKGGWSRYTMDLVDHPYAPASRYADFFAKVSALLAATDKAKLDIDVDRAAIAVREAWPKGEA